MNGSFWWRISLLLSVTLLVSGLTLTASSIYRDKISLISPVSRTARISPKPLDRYAIVNLRSGVFPSENITIGETVSESVNHHSRLFYLSSPDATISGLINIPLTPRPEGIIVLLRGFVDRQIYTPGTGTKRIGEKLAGSGFITLAPDFLGYGSSSSPSAYPLEERFQTYTTVLSLLSSLPTLPAAIQSAYPDYDLTTALSNIGLFGHSNGGHIALAVLEITGKNYPTVLWAPVSKPFPYSILYYTDEFDDKGRALRALIAGFEKDYDVNRYSIDNYFNDINARISIHQGRADIEVPVWWSGELVATLENLDKEVEYFTYPGEDHNFNGGSWETLATRTVNFYLKNLEK